MNSVRTEINLGLVGRDQTERIRCLFMVRREISFKECNDRFTTIEHFLLTNSETLKRFTFARYI